MVFYTAVHFRCRAKLEFGNRVVVVGSHNALGNWNCKKGHEMVVSDTVSDVWNSVTPAHLPLKERLEYRYAILNNNDEFLHWNEDANRQLEPTGSDMIVEDDEGYYRLECSTYSSKDDAQRNPLSILRPTDNKKKSDFNTSQELNHVKLDNKNTVYFVSSRLPVQVYKLVDGSFQLRMSNTPLTTTMWELRHRYKHKMCFLGACSVTKEPIEQALTPDSNVSTANPLSTSSACSRETTSGDADEYSPEDKEEITKLLAKENCIPIFVPRKLMIKSMQFCQRYMWNLFYNIGIWNVDEQNEFDWDLWSAYQQVNRLYALAVCEAATREDDFIWVHDYKLLMVPYHIVRKFRTANIALFMHAIFPSCSLFSCLPVHEEILRSMLCSDLIGFHYFEYVRHFLTSCKRILGLDHYFRVGGMIGIDYNGRQVMIRMSHAHLQPDLLEQKIGPGTRVPDMAKNLLEKWPNRFIVAAVDRETRLGGLYLKLKAFKRFLEQYPVARGKVLLVQYVCAQDTLWESRSDITSKLMQLVSEINEAHGKTHVILEFNVDVEAKLALFTAADCFMDTSIRGGINLAASEYIYCRKGKPACAIFSEFTGYSKTLCCAVLVNPWYIEGVMEALDTVMSMPQEERIEACKRDVEHMESRDTITWVEDFVRELASVRKRHDVVHLSWGFGKSYKTYTVSSNFDLLDTDHVLQRYMPAHRRLIFLDCEGTLSTSLSEKSFTRSNKELKQQLLLQSAPLDENIKSIEKLVADKRNVVVLISGRGVALMESWFGKIPGVGMCAEHGYRYKLEALGGDEWQCTVNEPNVEWRNVALEILEQYVQRTPGSYVNCTDAALVFQYHNCDSEFGALQARELYQVLSDMLSGFHVDLVWGRDHIEVKLAGVNKGSALLNIVKRCSAIFGDFDFILCVGDDRSDEEMFKALHSLGEWTQSGHDRKRSSYISCTIGKKPSKAQYYLHDHIQLSGLLQTLARSSHKLAGVSDNYHRSNGSDND